MDFISKADKAMFEGGKEGRRMWSILSCAQFVVVTYFAWQHDILSLSLTCIILCTFLYIAHNQVDATPTADAVDMWLRKRICSK
jgi:hypothetical protein